MKYIEVCKALEDRGNIHPIGLIKPEVRKHEFYVSMFPFDNSILNYVKTNGSIKGHKGKHFCDYILIDIDCEDDIDQSRIDAIEAIKRLNQLYEINPDELFIWFSGNKGFHIALISKLFGQLDPAENINEIVKGFVKHSMQSIDSNIDYAIYENHRIIRVENSLHKKSQLYKIQISYEELIKLSMLEIRRLAKQPRTLKRNISKSEIVYREKIKRDLKSPVIEKKNNIVQDGFFSPGNEGNRNNQLFKQACMLFKTSDLNEKSIYEIINSINHAGNNPLNDNEVFLLVESASKNKRQQTEEEIQVYTFNELIPEYIDSLRGEAERITLTFEKLNNEFKGKLRGQLGVVIGYGGSKKSLYAQNIAFDNILHQANNVIYSNMEMSNSKLMQRFIDIGMKADGYLPSIELENMFTSGSQIENILIDNLGVIFRDKLKICSTPSMTSDRFNDLIDKLNEKIDVLIVDGLSMMGGKGNELELANKHSKELKELAKKHNMLVLAIVHASKGEDLETRDLTRKARASEKIMDNCDFAMTMSLYKDEGEFKNEKGVYNCWNKRGTGNRIESGYE
jgi:KaiC/GvpD/RAD55 family RecA-like ATPase